jgi:hypothetical protein
MTTPATAERQSLLASYDPDLFVPHAKWESLARILAAEGGGSYGLSGPRGAGKTWAMREAKTWAEQREGLGVWFPSPSEYQATAFLAAISDVVALEFERYYDLRTGRTTRLARQQYWRGMLGSLLLTYVAGALIVVGVFSATTGTDLTRLRLYINAYTLVGTAVFLAAGLLLAQTRRRFREDREGLGRVRRAAEELRVQVRYIVSTKESSEIGAEASRLGLTARLKRARERELVDRPATLSSLIHNFRAFVEAIAAEIPGPVVIAVDELDKMADATLVADLLRDIKGIFDVRGTVYFLVSISDEAARSLELGAVRTRNEFNSSFYTVITLPPLQPHECHAIIKRRVDSFDEQIALAVGVLTGGIPREVVRVAERVQETRGESLILEVAVSTVIHDETQAFLDEVLTAPVGRDCLAPLERVTLFRAISAAADGSGNTLAASACTALARWNLNDASPAWQESFQEEWRRLLVRLAVAGLILRAPASLVSASDLSELQGVVKAASASAAVARTRLGSYLVSAMSGSVEHQRALDDGQVELASFLVARGNRPFNRRDLVALSGVDPVTAGTCLSLFRSYGILEHRGVRLGAAWKLSKRALQRLDGER